MTTLPFVEQLNLEVNVSRGPNDSKLFHALWLQHLELECDFTFVINEMAGEDRVEFLNELGFLSPNSVIKVSAKILEIGVLRHQGSILRDWWRVKLEFPVEKYEFHWTSMRRFTKQAEVWIDYNVNTRQGHVRDSAFARQCLSWNPHEDGANKGSLYFSRRIARTPMPRKPLDLLLDLPIEELELGVRAYNCLKRVGIETIGDLCYQTQSSLKTIPNFGGKTADEVKDALKLHGLTLKDEN